jgi:curved DNA-binding protein CbpA
VTTRSQRARRVNPYEVLGISSMATAEEITKAYRTLAKKFHPDRYAGRSENVRRAAEQRMAELNEAYKLARERTARRDEGYFDDDEDGGGGGGRRGPWQAGDVGAWSRTARRTETSAQRAARLQVSRAAAERAARSHESQARSFQRIRLEARKNARYTEAVARSKAGQPSNLFGAGQAAHTNELQCRNCRSIARLPSDWQQRLDTTAYFCGDCSALLLNR